MVKVNGHDRDRIDMLDRKVAALIQKTNDMHSDILDIKNNFSIKIESCGTRFGKIEHKLSMAQGGIGAIGLIVTVITISKLAGIW